MDRFVNHSCQVWNLSLLRLDVFLPLAIPCARKRVHALNCVDRHWCRWICDALYDLEPGKIFPFIILKKNWRNPFFANQVNHLPNQKWSFETLSNWQWLILDAFYNLLYMNDEPKDDGHRLSIKMKWHTVNSLTDQI